MASKDTINLKFAGDASDVTKAMEKVGAGAKNMAADLDKAGGKAKDFGSKLDRVGEAAGDNEGKFMGTADVLDGLATTMGFNIDRQIELARGFGDIAGGLEQITPMVSGVAKKLGGLLGITTSQVASTTSLTAATGAQAGATNIQTAATERQTIAQRGLNIAMAMNPIGIVVIALTALTAAFIIAYKKSETFRDIVHGGLSAVKDIAGEVADFFTEDIPKAFDKTIGWVKRNWPEIATIISGPFAPITALATDAFGIRSGLTNALGKVKDEASEKAKAVWSGMKTAITAPIALGTWLKEQITDKVTNWLDSAKDNGERVAKAIWNGITGFGGKAVEFGKDLMGGIRDALGNAAVGPINTMRKFLNFIIRAINHIPLIPDIGELPMIEKFAKGGIVRGPVMGLVGEAGPEAIIPLSPSKRGRAQDLMTQTAKIIGLPGGFPSDGVHAFANGGIVSPFGYVSAKDWAQTQVNQMKQKGLFGGAVDALKGFAAGGAKAILDLVPSPNIGVDFLNDIGQGIKNALRAGIDSIFGMKDSWLPDRLMDAFNWAMSQMGKPYVWGGGHGSWNYNLNGYDCSGFASHAAKKAGSSIPSPGTTMSLYPGSRAGQGPFAWGFRGMSSNNARVQHMGARILGEWFQFGNPGRSGGSDSQWESLRVPPGLEAFANGGIVPGRRGQAVPILAHAGERVVPATRANQTGNTIIFKIDSADPRAAGKFVVDAVRAYERQNGQLFARV